MFSNDLYQALSVLHCFSNRVRGSTNQNSSYHLMERTVSRLCHKRGPCRSTYIVSTMLHKPFYTQSRYMWRSNRLYTPTRTGSQKQRHRRLSLSPSKRYRRLLTITHSALLAVVWTVMLRCHYLKEDQLTIRIDEKELLWIPIMAKAKQKVGYIRLGSYNFELNTGHHAVIRRQAAVIH